MTTTPSSLSECKTNLDRWRFFLKDCTSPDTYINFGFYYMIAAALQRRVWHGSEGIRPLHPNLYVVLVGKPAIGKGLVIGNITSILTEHKIKSSNEQPKPRNKLDVDSIIASLRGDAPINRGGEESRLILPTAADATTYESLVHCMARSVRHIKYPKWDDKQQKFIEGIYSHSSLQFCLEEIGSLFRKRTEDIVNFLQQAYDCTDRYEKTTKTQGNDLIFKLCLNFFGGTTPDFMESIFNDQLLNQGFASRTMFIFEWQNRFNRLFITDFDKEQLEARRLISEHIKKLTSLYGQWTFTQEAKDYLKNWWEVDMPRGIGRANTSSKLDSYYGRKQIHLMKLAAIIHFADIEVPTDPSKTNMEVNLDCCLKAMETLDYVEKKMHYALDFAGNNPLYRVAQKILKYMVNKRGIPVSLKELQSEFFSETTMTGLVEVLTHLHHTGKINVETKTHPITHKSLGMFYTLAKEAAMGEMISAATTPTP